jgi:hypothetical protein
VVGAGAGPATTTDARRRTVARRGDAAEATTDDAATTDRVVRVASGATTRPTRVADARVVVAIAIAISRVGDGRHVTTATGWACPEGARRRARRSARARATSIGIGRSLYPRRHPLTAGGGDTWIEIARVSSFVFLD